jgi:hypothetical protein
MVFEREKLERLNKLTLLTITLTIQRSSKVNISDNTFNYFASQLCLRKVKTILTLSDLQINKPTLSVLYKRIVQFNNLLFV